MAVYLITIFIILILGSIQTSHIYYLENDDATFTPYTPIIYILPLALVLIIVGGFRFDVGTDYWNYFLMRPTWETVQQRIITLNEPLVYGITYLCRRIWDDGAFVILCEQIITIWLVFKGLRNLKTESYTLPLLLYIFYCGWLFSFNGVRQALACSIVFAYANVVTSKKRWLIKSIVVCFAAFLAHRTAILFLPILLLSRRRFSWMQIFLFSLVSMVVYYGGDYAYTFMGGAVENVGEYAIRTINILRVVVAFVPAILCIYALISNCVGFIEENSLLMNLGTINAFITLGTMNSAYLNRFSYYTIIFNMCLIPKLGDVLGDRNRTPYRIIVAILFFVYFLFELGSSFSFNWVFNRIGLY